MTTLHKASDDMASLEKALGAHFEGCFERDFWQITKAAIPEAVHFDFGDIAPAQEHVDFGMDMLTKNLFRLPFPTVFYSGTAMPKRGLIASYDEDTDAFAVICFLPARLGGSTKHIAPTTLIRVYAQGDQVRCDFVPISKARFRVRGTNKIIGDEHHKNSAIMAGNFVLGATVLLMGKDVDVETRPAPEKLNKQRLRRGKSAIGESRFVRLKIGATHDYTQLGGTHKSPRMHIRRGHFRQVWPDRPPIPIPPHWVAARDDANLPDPKEYLVKS
jgi:hypothetical protein